MPEINNADTENIIVPKLDLNPLREAFAEHHEKIYRHENEDGSLRKLRWAEDGGFDGERQDLHIHQQDGEFDMAHSSATGDALVSNGFLGVDLIRVDQGGGFVPHTHPGDHILMPVMGKGTITYGGTVYRSEPGEIYIIEGQVPHAVGAIEDHAILAVGAPHAPIDSEERMKPVEYESVTTEIEDIKCLICEVAVSAPTKLHDRGCPHCPCYRCVPTGDEQHDHDHHNHNHSHE